MLLGGQKEMLLAHVVIMVGSGNRLEYGTCFDHIRSFTLRTAR